MLADWTDRPAPSRWCIALLGRGNAWRLWKWEHNNRWMIVRLISFLLPLVFSAKRWKIRPGVDTADCLLGWNDEISRAPSKKHLFRMRLDICSYGAAHKKSWSLGLFLCVLQLFVLDFCFSRQCSARKERRVVCTWCKQLGCPIKGCVLVEFMHSVETYIAWVDSQFGI